MLTNPFDWLVIALLLLGAARGYAQGVVLELFGLGAWIASYFAARAWATLLASLFSSASSPPTLHYFVAFGTIFILTMFALNMLGNAFKRIVQSIGAASADHVLGAVAGGAKVFFLLLLTCALLQATSARETQWWQQSVAISYLKPLLPLLPIPQKWLNLL